mmetsp:Transcript_137222/g.256214  ORF Transcript_137222/g.256214 Transcript_137222/m.256214 type:complete len:477 (+) Transcript_137222:150-1580(+)
MRTALFVPSFSSRTSLRCTAFLAVTCVFWCVPAFLPEEPEVAKGSGSLHKFGSSTKEQCSSAQQQQDDTTVFLQGGRLHVERVSERYLEEQTEQAEDTLEAVQQLPMAKLFAPSASSQKEDIKTVLQPVKALRTSLLNLVSRVSAVHESIAGRSHVGIWLIVAMILCTVFAACGVFVPAMFEKDEKKTPPKTYLRTNDMMTKSPGPVTGTMPALRPVLATSSSAPSLPSPVPPKQYPASSTQGKPAGSSGSQYQPIYRPFGSQAAPLRTKQPPDLQSGVISKHMPPPLCPTLVLPVCAARFGVPMVQIANLTSEGDLSIVGLSGNPLLRASVRKVGSRRSLEIAMPEGGSAPRATIGPNLQNLNDPDDGVLEIRGLKNAFYGMLELRPSGACYVIRDGERMMAIDGDTDSLQLSIRSAAGMQWASVLCSTEPFGVVDHLEIRVEPGVDTVLILACVLAVLLLSPTSSSLRPDLTTL